MKTMLENVTNTDNAQLKQATLTAIGYVCEQIVRTSDFHRCEQQRTNVIYVIIKDPHILQPQSGAILTAVVQGARKEEPK
jgi:importin subunit beta-1